MDYIFLILISCFCILLWVDGQLDKIRSQTYKIQNKIQKKITELESDDITKEQEQQIKENIFWELRNCHNKVKDLRYTVYNSKNIILGILIVGIFIYLILTRDERPDYKIDWFKMSFYLGIPIVLLVYGFLYNLFRSKD